MYLSLQDSALQGQIWGPRGGSEAPGVNLRLQGGFELIRISEPIADYLENTSIYGILKNAIYRQHHGVYGKYRHLGRSKPLREPPERKKTPKC